MRLSVTIPAGFYYEHKALRAFCPPAFSRFHAKTHRTLHFVAQCSRSCGLGFRAMVFTQTKTRRYFAPRAEPLPNWTMTSLQRPRHLKSTKNNLWMTKKRGTQPPAALLVQVAEWWEDSSASLPDNGACSSHSASWRGHLSHGQPSGAWGHSGNCNFKEMPSRRGISFADFFCCHDLDIPFRLRLREVLSLPRTRTLLRRRSLRCVMQDFFGGHDALPLIRTASHFFNMYRTTTTTYNGTGEFTDSFSGRRNIEYCHGDRFVKCPEGDFT